MTPFQKPQQRLSMDYSTRELAHFWTLLSAPWVFRKVSDEAANLQAPQVPQPWDNSVYQVQEPRLIEAPEKQIFVTVTRDGGFECFNCSSWIFPS